jgi:MFS transporter, DHA1 family, multidrug resistance protein
MNVLLKNRGAALLLMLNVFLIFTGVGLIVPIMPAFMNELHMSGSILGMLVAAFSLSQLLFSPLAGRMSDSLGRKNVILVGMIVFAGSELIFATANTAPVLFLARILGGLGAAMIMPTCMAYMADITTDEERAQGMGFINAAITTGFIIGPGLGGYIAEFGIRAPFYGATGAALVAAALTFFVLPDSVPSEERAKAQSAVKQPSLFQQLIGSYKEPYFLSLLLIFVISFGLANHETVFSLFVDHKFGFTAKDIAFVITFGSIAGALVQLTVFGWIINRLGEERVIIYCLLASSVFVLLTLFVTGFWSMFGVTFFVFLAMDILRPALSTRMSRSAQDNQGYIAGLNSAFSSLGNILGPLAAGALFDIHVDYPFAVSALVLFLSFAGMLAATIKRFDGKPKDKLQSLT